MKFEDEVFVCEVSLGASLEVAADYVCLLYSILPV